MEVWIMIELWIMERPCERHFKIDPMEIIPNHGVQAPTLAVQKPRSDGNKSSDFDY